MSTRIRGSQILDGTIDIPDISPTLKSEINKVAVTSNDSTPDFLSNKILAGDGITMVVMGSSGSYQHLVLSSSAQQAACCASEWGVDGAGIVFTTSSIRVDGDAEFDGTVNFNVDEIELTGSLFVSGSSTFDGDVNVVGFFNAEGGVELSGSALEISGSLLVSGSSELCGDLNVCGTIYGSGAEISIEKVIISETLLVTGSVNMEGSLKINGFDLSTGGWRNIWYANLTSGQTIQSWTDGVNNDVIDVTGKKLSWKFHQGSGATAGMTSSGLELTYPSTNASGSCGSLSFSLGDLGLGGMGGLPWRMLLRCEPTGTIQSGTDSLQIGIDLDGSNTSSSDCSSQHGVFFNKTYDSTSLTEISTNSIANDFSSADTTWDGFNVICLEQSCGMIAFKLGNFSTKFPKDAEMSPLACGSITGQSGPYQMNSRIFIRIAAGETSPQFSGRSWVISRVLVQRL